MNVNFSEDFIPKYQKMPKNWRNKINRFVSHVRQRGFDGLMGRNKSSENVPQNHPTFIKTVQHARQHRLWHYHIGIEEYDETNVEGDWTSEYVLHYSLNESFILICTCEKHPPMRLPSYHQLQIKKNS